MLFFLEDQEKHITPQLTTSKQNVSNLINLMGLDLIILSFNELQEHKGFARLDCFSALVGKESYKTASSIKFNDK